MSDLQKLFDEESNKKFFTHSPEARAKISTSRKGKVISSETRAKMRKPKSEETKIIMSIARKGRKSPMLGKILSQETRDKMKKSSHTKKAVMTPLGRFDSLNEAARVYCVYPTQVSRWVKDSKKTEFFLV